MGRLAESLRRYRLPLAAVAVSAALHAAVFVGMPARLPSLEPGDDVATYSATLDPAAIAVEAPPAAVPAPARPKAAAPHRVHAKAKPRPAPPPSPEAPPPATLVAQADADAVGPPVPPPESEPASENVASAAVEGPPAPPKVEEPRPDEPRPDVVALAQPIAPPPEPTPPPFNAEALPASLSISYALTSAFADGRADYEWTRDGDSYRIHGEAQAEGFFTLFLEGRIVQESRGTVTSTGLRPDRFVERRPGAEEEGLEFDWPQHQVTFEKGSEKKTKPFSGDTVDWLSMIFQLAHVPPKPKGDTMELAVFTQRRFYSFRLKVLGLEEIDIPLGHVQALHLRHVDEKNANEVVDVWLGVDQHYLPVKMRYPIAKNRLVVEQSATRVTAH